jgi:hypothetical protein
MVSKETARRYRQRAKTSKCRKVPKPACTQKPSCKYATGKKRQFCRTKTNTRLSKCRKVPKPECVVKPSCKYATGKKRQFCRTKTNTRLSKYSSSTSGSYPVLNLQELRNKKPMIKPMLARLQPVENRQKVNNERGLDDWGSSSSAKRQPRLQPVANRRKVAQNKNDMNDWGSSE